MASLKQNLKQILIDRQHRLYTQEVAGKNLTYDSWVRQKENRLKIDPSILEEDKKSQTNDVEQVNFGGCKVENAGNISENDDFCCRMDEIFERTESNILFLTLYEGEISRIAYKLLPAWFASNENLILIYGDEDVKKEAVRENPWFKPDWSPDRFLSSLYFGGLVAVKTWALKAAYVSCQKRKLFLQIDNKQGENRKNKEIEKLYLLLFEMLKVHNAFKKGHEELKMPVCHVSQILYHSRENGYEQIRNYRLPEASMKELKEDKAGLLSVIVPSKDNPDVLFQCLDSFITRTSTKYAYEIILVDNGSNEENRRRITEKLETLNACIKLQEGEGAGKAGFAGARYLYTPMNFNFSRMCNLGAESAEGQLYLFLNDDMEIIQPDWLDLMMEKALYPYAGAVGAKLLYPDSDIIQHAGITNLRVGPAHKLQFLSDREVHYFGMNRGVHDMLAVTGACLMVRKEVFRQAGGFCEELAVAFNDVDLCYTIHEQGYYNMVRNDVVLYHHESLSRGKDGESREKQLRLLGEKDVLYERHQEIYGHDPFYNMNLTTDMLESEYSPAYRYQVNLHMPWADLLSADAQVKKAREDQCLVVGMECAMDIYKWQYGVSPEKGKIKVKPEDMGYYFQGYSFIIGSDNACYKKKLLLKNCGSNQVWAIPVEGRYRQDIKNNLKDQLNVDLTGFTAKLRREDLLPGTYQFGMLAEDKCSRQKLVNWSNWVLEVKKEDWCGTGYGLSQSL